MKLALAVVLNAGLLWLLWRWLQPRLREPRLGPWLAPLLGLKVVACAVATVRFTGDPAYYLAWSVELTKQLWAAPAEWLAMLFSDEFHFGGYHLVFHGFSNTLFFIKLLSVLNLAGLGHALLLGLYCSVAGFVGCWELARAAVRVWPATPAGVVPVAFLLWPSVVYWTAGITKESLLVGSGAALTALVVGWLYGGRPLRLRGVVAAAALLALHVEMRFFFAGLLLAALSGLALLQLAERLGLARRWAQVLLLAGLLSGGAWTLGQISPVFSFNKFTSRLIINYHELRRDSQNRPHFEYPNLRPTAASLLAHAPHAVANTLTRPWPWEAATALYLVAGLENVLLLLVLAAAAVAAARGRPGYLPFAVVLVVLTYDVLLAALLGLSTPNLGTLNRYRAALLPYVLLLALQHDGAARWLRKVGF